MDALHAAVYKQRDSVNKQQQKGRGEGTKRVNGLIEQLLTLSIRIKPFKIYPTHSGAF